MKEFLAKGGKIQKLPTEPFEKDHKIGSTTKNVPQLKTLAEGELLYGKKKKVTKKVKEPDYTGINMDLIPDHIKKLINFNQNKEESNETDKNSRSSQADNKS